MLEIYQFIAWLLLLQKCCVLSLSPNGELGNGGALIGIQNGNQQGQQTYFNQQEFFYEEVFDKPYEIGFNSDKISVNGSSSKNHEEIGNTAFNSTSDVITMGNNTNVNGNITFNSTSSEFVNGNGAVGNATEAGNSPSPKKKEEPAPKPNPAPAPQEGHGFPQFETKRDELLFWAAKSGNEQIIQTHLAEVAVCTLVKDEHIDILEWIQYHRFIGIGKFYLYDNNSNPPMIHILKPLLSRGIVEYQYINDTFLADDYFILKKRLEFQKRHGRTYTELANSVQVWAVTNCVTNYRGRHKWIALMDVDEFFFFPDKHPVQDPPHLPSFLTNYEEAGGLVIYRKNFGSSGHIERPKEGVLASYTKCSLHMADEERQFYPKIILNTQYFKQGGECRIHECTTIKKMMNTKKDLVESRWWWEHPTATWDKLLVHHYFTKSLQDFRLKQQRGMAHSRASRKKKDLFRPDSFFYSLDNTTQADCMYGVEYSKVCCQSSIKNSQLIFNRFMHFHSDQKLSEDDLQSWQDNQQIQQSEVESQQTQQAPTFKNFDVDGSDPADEEVQTQYYMKHTRNPF